MVDENTEQFGPNPERYKRLAEPIARAEAEENATAFMRGVGKLRERYHIPELIVQFEVNVLTDEGGQVMSGGCGWGNQLRQAQLARKAADREFAYLGTLIESACLALPELWRTLIIDPADETPISIPKD